MKNTYENLMDNDDFYKTLYNIYNNKSKELCEYYKKKISANEKSVRKNSDIFMMENKDSKLYEELSSLRIL
jgi:hypothetical protein